MTSIKTNQEGNMDARNFVKLYNMIIPVGLVYHKVTLSLNTASGSSLNDISNVSHQYVLSSATSPSSLSSSQLTTDRAKTLNNDSQITYKAKNTDTMANDNSGGNNILTTSIFHLTTCQVKTDAQIS